MRRRPNPAQSSLFDIPEAAAAPAPIERPYSEDGLFLGTSAFSANGWSGSFYPPGLKPSEYLSFAPGLPVRRQGSPNRHA